MDMIERLMSNPYAWLFLFLCTVASLIFAIYTWIKGKKTKEILHNGNDEKIHVEYKIKGGKPKRNCAELRKEGGIKKIIKAIADELISVFIWLFVFLMTALFVNAMSNLIGVTGEGVLVTTSVLSIPLTLIIIPSASVAKQILDDLIEANKGYWPELK